ncbi:centriolar coiled-coil protein of 110 kDa [Chanos chanos]|uniref:Centriolar coiled-coil protein of 110 kDa n=1 Tax=Chanos chanos TaxID=29144 RepID=A0A6J2WPZ4_CHACN|nr:centriolar coiled-coil protein of 110 kDa [Chanos chanos]
MESYEDFFLRSLTKLRSERQGKTSLSSFDRWLPPSVICFRGRAVLSPLLSEKQRREMLEYREKAVQRETERQALHKRNLLSEVQNILDNVQVQKIHEVPVDSRVPSAGRCPKPHVNGVMAVSDTSSTPSGHGGDTVRSPRPVTPQQEPPMVLNGTEGESGEGEDGNVSCVSLQSLLRRSREYIEKEQGRRGSRVNSRTATAMITNDSLSDKENENSSPVGDSDIDLLGHIQNQNALKPGHTQNQSHRKPQPGSHPNSCYDSLLGCLPQSLIGSHMSEPGLSPRPHRSRPRPVSTGNILISFPISSGEPNTGAPGRSQVNAQNTFSPKMERRALESPGNNLAPSTSSNNRRASHCGSSPVSDVDGQIGVSGLGPIGHEMATPNGFRRRCHTLDSHLCPPHQNLPIDRSQERVPRFMAGVYTQRAPCRRSPSKTISGPYSPESPVPALPRPSLTPDPSLDTEALSIRATPTEEKRADEVQRRMQALEEMQRRLEEEHALQMSLLMAEQEREQQRLCQELEERDRRQREQGVRCVGGEVGGEWKAVCERYPTLNPSCPPSPAERSPGHSTPSIGFPSPVSPVLGSPSVQPYVWGSSWGPGKTRGRLSQVLTLEQQRALCRIGAIVRGFLTRRLLKTEKVKHLRQTVQDTQEFIRSFQNEAPQKRCSVSPQDLSLQERVRAQLRAALFDVHDIFFEMPLVEQLALLQQDRELRTERKLREMEKARSPKDKVTLSAATQKSLDRKKQRVSQSPGQTRRVQQKPKSPPTNRILQPSQGQNAPVPGHLLRQGSLYRKTPEERVKRSDSLKKQHSLG